MRERTRIQNQDDWKRTQIRIPLGLYEDLVEHAKKNDISINTAMLFLMDKGLLMESSNATIENIPTEDLMMELASRMKGYTITVSEKSDIKKAP
ncbi:hypothetical protein [Acinetobacter baumannii]|uniref:hypothetical protein n=1 Tax=Acinetobacter baumannii TaxID=470 RepID=UPI001057701D|nr:hypothetical protein [Acinetobacter baumannii]MDC4982329.1 hypothetical protein [Acinetobacter baumannii]MDC5255690.1 hypothetical protein [Acinetobacter baumannii]MDC5371931.1 hypothetical protein [Acinetobacter baumannii]MDC5470341.1 hypothetical protein [Acinetobacter baumannii]QBM32294.1 hypothetical protein E1A89_01290 [Acinetobacter baumannii]